LTNICFYHICSIICYFTTSHTSTFNNIKRKFFGPISCCIIFFRSINTNLSLIQKSKFSIAFLFNSFTFLFASISNFSGQTKYGVSVTSITDRLVSIYEKIQNQNQQKKRESFYLKFQFKICTIKNPKWCI